MIKFIPFLVVLAGVFGGVYLVNNTTNLFSRAANTKIESVLISNITDSSFVVTYYTPQIETYTKVFYGNSTLLDKEAKDSRDSTGILARNTHYVVIRNLQPDTEYTFMISGDPDRKFYRQKTAKSLSVTAPLGHVYSGQILDETNNLSKEAVVYFWGPDGQLLSTFTQDGRFRMDVAKYLKKDLSAYRPMTPVNIIEFFVNAGIQGLGYYDMYAVPEKTDIKIYLEQGNLPFFKIKFPGEGSDVNTPAPSIPPGAETINQSTPRQQTSTPGFMETVWLTITQLFGGQR